VYDFVLNLEKVFSIDDEIPSKKLFMLALASVDTSARIKKGSILRALIDFIMLDYSIL
jgi:hypothetical protein